MSPRKRKTGDISNIGPVIRQFKVTHKGKNKKANKEMKI